MNPQSIARANRRSGWKPIDTVPTKRARNYSILGGNSLTKAVAVLYWNDTPSLADDTPGRWIMGHGERAYGFDLWQPLPAIY